VILVKVISDKEYEAGYHKETFNAAGLAKFLKVGARHQILLSPILPEIILSYIK